MRIKLSLCSHAAMPRRLRPSRVGLRSSHLFLPDCQCRRALQSATAGKARSSGSPTRSLQTPCVALLLMCYSTVNPGRYFPILAIMPLLFRISIGAQAIRRLLSHNLL